MTDPYPKREPWRTRAKREQLRRGYGGEDGAWRRWKQRVATAVVWASLVAVAGGALAFTAIQIVEHIVELWRLWS